jgi:hypothetical protein
MAKKTKHAGKEREHKHMGTHTDMVLRDDVTVHLDLGGEEKEKFTIVAEDDNGKYFTQRHWVGTGLLDPNRDPLRRRPKTSLSEEDIEIIFPVEETEKVEA